MSEEKTAIGEMSGEEVESGSVGDDVHTVPSEEGAETESPRQDLRFCHPPLGKVDSPASGGNVDEVDKRGPPPARGGEKCCHRFVRIPRANAVRPYGLEFGL